MEGNNVTNKFRVAGAGGPKKATDLRKDLFQHFNIRSLLKTRLPKNIFVAKARSLCTEYCQLQRKLEPQSNV